MMRVLGMSLVTAGLGAGLAFGLFGKDSIGVALILGCVGAIVGALAGVARETVSALRQKPLI